MKITNQIFAFINTKIRNFRLLFLTHNLRKNPKLTILTDNCLAGFVCHDLSIRFNAPLINGEFSCDDYIKFLNNIPHYLNSDLEFYHKDGYIFAHIKDIDYKFTHYNTIEQALTKWDSRKVRMNFDNIFVIMCEKEGCTYENLIDFSNLPYKNKIIFTHKPYPEIKCAFHIKGFEDKGSLGVISDYMPHQILGKRYYDQFDFAKWFQLAKS